MAVLISLGGNTSGDGFLLAPLDSTYDAELALWTDAETASVSLQASPNPAGLVFSQTAVDLSTTPTIVTVHAMVQSASRGDTTIEVLDGATVVASFTVTSIKHPVVNFRGRFEVRFSTDGATYNLNPIYTETFDTVDLPGWTWGLEGEPPFVPAVGNVPENLETTGLGRVVRFNNPVALRSHVAPVVSTVDSISGETSSSVETFFAGDSLIGQPVDLGPHTYLASNRPQDGNPDPEESWSATFEPMALFELHLGNRFSGASQVGPFTHKATEVNEVTRTPDSRPLADGLVDATAELVEFGLPPDTEPWESLTTFSMTRVDALVADYNALPAADTPERRNLARRIGHLVGQLTDPFGRTTAAGIAKGNQVSSSNPVFAARSTTLPGGWHQKEVFTGTVDANLMFNPAGSSVVTYLSEFQSFAFEAHLFAFHSDELCGYHKGSLTPDLKFHGSYIGDPHTHTVNGTSYDFQAVGELTLLRDGDAMEIQVRQTPVVTPNPLTDSHTGLTSCASVITAVAARVGEHRIAYQPGQEREQLQFYLDGKPSVLPPEGIDLGGHRVTAFDANSETGLRVDYDNGTVLIVVPSFWSDYNIWYMNVSVWLTKADEGIMGFIPRDSWLPRLRDGATVGPMSASLHDRYVALYKAFADSWRVIDDTSLFVYEPGTSTKTFTDEDWPTEQPPCTLKPAFEIPGAPMLDGMAIDEAELICKAVTEDDLHRGCLADVAATGAEIFAKDYRLAQELRLYGTAVQLVGGGPPSQPHRSAVGAPPNQPDASLIVAATVLPLSPGRPTPTGIVTFYIDGVPMDRPVELDGRGRARVTVARAKAGEQSLRGGRGSSRRITATYSGGGTYNYRSSTSASLLAD